MSAIINALRHEDEVVLSAPITTISGTLFVSGGGGGGGDFRSGGSTTPTAVSRTSTDSTDLESDGTTPTLSTPEPEAQLRAAPYTGKHTLVSRIAPDGGPVRGEPVLTAVTSLRDVRLQVASEEKSQLQESPRKQGSIVTIFAIWNTMMGSSLLIMPWAIAQAGYILGIGLTIFLGCLSYYTCSLVLSTSEKQRDEADEEKVCKPEFTDFGDAIEHFLGRKLSFFGVLISLLTFLGALIAYWIFMSRFLFNVGNVINHYAWDANHTLHGSHMRLEAPEEVVVGASLSKFSDYWSAEYTVPLYLVLILYPISCMREPTVFTKFNALGVGSVFILIGYVIYRAIIWGVNMDPQVDNSIVGFNTKFPAITGSLSMGFFIHNGILPITAHHARPEKKRRDLGIAYLLVALTYLTIGIIYYVAYPDRKDGIPDNFLRLVTKNDIYGIVASVFLLFQMVTVYPLLLFMFRTQFMSKILRITNYRYRWIFGLNAAVVCVCVLLAMFWPRVGALIRIVGAISGFVYNYTFPCLVYLAALRAAGLLTKMTVIGHSLIVVFGVLNLVGQFVIPLD